MAECCFLWAEYKMRPCCNFEVMAAGSNNQAGSSLEVTPTWATAAICSVIVLVSLVVQRGLHYAGLWLKQREYRPLKNALENIKEELMLLGVISLLLAVSQPFTTEICVSHSFIQTMLPCNLKPRAKSRKIYETVYSNRREMVAGSGGHCASKGKTPILGAKDIHDLHMFIFILAVVHVSYSLVTIFLGGRKIRSWKKWESEAHGLDINKALENQEAKFVHRHIRNSKILGVAAAFFQQFIWSVSKEDYLTLRHAFTHKYGVDEEFDFHWYLKRSMADDFKVVVGISEYFWVFVIAFFLLNVHGWHTYFWISFIPISLLLILGAKLQHILGTLATDIVKSPGEPIQLRNNIFWFGKPKLLLYLLHFTLFQNAFELALFFWIWATFGIKSCLLENKSTAILHIVTGVVVQIQCTYITLPLYALISQMGSDYKHQLFEEQRLLASHELKSDVVNKSRDDAEEASSSSQKYEEASSYVPV